MDYKVLNPTKRAHFKDEVETRVNRIIRAVEQIADLANPKKYEYTMTDVNAIESAVQKSMNEMKARFEHSKKSTFTLGDEQ